MDISKWGLSQWQVSYQQSLKEFSQGQAVKLFDTFLLGLTKCKDSQKYLP